MHGDRHHAVLALVLAVLFTPWCVVADLFDAVVSAQMVRTAVASDVQLERQELCSRVSGADKPLSTLASRVGGGRFQWQSHSSNDRVVGLAHGGCGMVVCVEKLAMQRDRWSEERHRACTGPIGVA